MTHTDNSNSVPFQDDSKELGVTLPQAGVALDTQNDNIGNGGIKNLTFLVPRATLPFTGAA